MKSVWKNPVEKLKWYNKGWNKHFILFIFYSRLLVYFNLFIIRGFDRPWCWRHKRSRLGWVPAKEPNRDASGAAFYTGIRLTNASWIQRGDRARATLRQLQLKKSQQPTSDAFRRITFIVIELESIFRLARNHNS